LRTGRTTELRIDPVACQAHGLCHELLPEWISRDEWGYPLLVDNVLPHVLVTRARRMAATCPTLALRISTVERLSTADPSRRVRANGESR
jgi:ferredoxin